jgi:mono/diheme cytochrome c family protein
LSEINAPTVISGQGARQVGPCGRFAVRAFVGAFGLVVALAPMVAHAGDAAAGRQLAQSRCAVCHQVAPSLRDEQADAPPFAIIAQKFPADGAGLIVALRGPHQKMNFRPSQREAEDIAAYIRTLAR